MIRNLFIIGLVGGISYFIGKLIYAFYAVAKFTYQIRPR